MIICELKRRVKVMHINIVLTRVKVKGVKVEYKDKSGTVATSTDRYTVETKVEHETMTNTLSALCTHTWGHVRAHTHTVGRDMTNTVCLQCLALNVKNSYGFLFYSRIKTRAIQGTCYCARVFVRVHFMDYSQGYYV